MVKVITPCVDDVDVVVIPTPWVVADMIVVLAPCAVNVDVVEVTTLCVDDDDVSIFLMLIMMMMFQVLYAGNAYDDLALQVIWFLVLIC